MDRTFPATMLLAGFSTCTALPSGAAAQQIEPPQAGQPAPRDMPPGLKAAAATPGVEADTLFAAMTDAGGPRADLAATAAVTPPIQTETST